MGMRRVKNSVRTVRKVSTARAARGDSIRAWEFSSAIVAEVSGGTLALSRESLERAAVSFGALGADGWVARARSELQRVGGRRRTGSVLTPSERQVSELAAEGLSNKEIAAALYVTVNTVEVHLARAYTKLGVRSRSQLAKRLARGS